MTLTSASAGAQEPAPPPTPIDPPPVLPTPVLPPPVWPPTALPPPVLPPPLLPPPADAPDTTKQRASTSWELYATIFAGTYSIEYAAAGAPEMDGSRGSGTLNLRRYVGLLEDDDAPRALQPFLQRASYVYGYVQGSGFVTPEPADRLYTEGGVSAGSRWDANVEGGLGFDVYVTRWLALRGSLAYAFDHLVDHRESLVQRSDGVTASGGLGFRFDDARIDLVYGFEAQHIQAHVVDADTQSTSWAPLRWGTLEATSFVVIHRVVSLNPWLEVLSRGGGGGLNVGVYATQSLSFDVGAFGQHGQLFNLDEIVLDRASTHGTIAYWFTPRVAASVGYQFTYDSVPPQPIASGSSQFQHEAMLQGAFRIP